MRKFEGRHAARLKEGREAANEIVDVRYMRKHVVGGRKVCGAPLFDEASGEVPSEKRLNHLDALRSRGLGCARSWFDPVTGNAVHFEILQQIPVVGGDLANRGIGIKPEAGDHLRCVLPRMVEPRRRERAEVGVVSGEKRIAARIVEGLHEPARLADHQAQRQPNFRRLHLFGGQIGVGRRRDAQVEKFQLERRPAVATFQMRSPS